MTGRQRLFDGAWQAGAYASTAILALLTLHSIALLVMQHPAVCECGRVAL